MDWRMVGTTFGRLVLRGKLGFARLEENLFFKKTVFRDKSSCKIGFNQIG